MSPVIALLTDFGLHDAYVGTMKGVVLSRNPAATFVDLCHAVPPQDVARGAFLLATAVPYFPPGTIFLAVVDPGVGTARRPLLVEAAGRLLVGPDNGLFGWTLRFLADRGELRLTATGSHLRLVPPDRAVELTATTFWRPEAASTFHGRDIFAPVAAELSLGRPALELGRPLEALLDLPWPEPVRESSGRVLGQVVTVDGYGNLITNLAPPLLPLEPVFEIAGWQIQGLAAHFQSASPLLALVGSSGLVEIAVPNGSAARLLGAGPGVGVVVVPR